MCGICGKVGYEQAYRAEVSLVRKMMERMHHRGPDEEGLYESGQAALGHKRLSIIDLSSGKQPLCNEDGSVWIVFNGEIYNFLELRAWLVGKGHRFKTKSDTEVIVHLYEEYGAACVTKLRGMFAFAVWDDKVRVLTLARDRVGIKPLYYYQTKDGLAFASELKSLLVDESVTREINPGAIDRFLTFQYLPGNDTLIKGIHKLAPGHCLTLGDGKVRIHQYWDLCFRSDHGHSDVEEATGRLVELLRCTVRDHLISDVPVGVLLSGGVDSTAILSFAAEESGTKLYTFTIGFENESFADERMYAELAAKRFGTEHHACTMTAEDFFAFLPKYVWHMEEPVCEPPAVALYFIAKYASSYVKVLLSGEGGDEAFAGYPNYRNMLWLENAKKYIRPVASPVAWLLRAYGKSLRAPRIAKYATLIDTPFEQYYYSRSSGPFTFFNRHRSDLYALDFADKLDDSYRLDPVQSLFATPGLHDDRLQSMLYIDTKTWLPDDLLVKADKMTMANSLELRVPLLDHQVLEFAASLSSDVKIRGRGTKFLLKRAFRDRVPEEIVKRKKAGFPVPYEKWLYCKIEPEIRDTILGRRALDRGYFNPKLLRSMLEREAAGGLSKEIFSLFILELWHRAFLDRCVSP